MIPPHRSIHLYVKDDIHIKSGGTIYADGGPDIHLNKPGPTLDIESIEDPDWNSNKKGRE